MPILFQKDWAKFPGATPDYDTTNKSWLEIASLYDQVGIKNCLFPLALHNQRLKGIDPYDPMLSYQDKLDIRLECTANPWFYWREVHRVPAASGGYGKQYQANRACISVLWSLLNSIDYYLEQIRQTGKSITGNAWVLWYHRFCAQGTRSTLFTKSDLIKEQIFELKKTRALLPDYLRVLTDEDTDNQNEFTNMELGNRLVAVRPQPEVEAANNAGRGIRTPFNLFDEFPFPKNIHITFPAAQGGMAAAAKDARTMGIPSATLMSSTPGKLDTEEGAFCHDILISGYPFSERLYDTANNTELEQVIRAGSTSLKPLITGRFTHTNLGITDDELRMMIANTRNKDLTAIKRDFFLRWSNGTVHHPLSPELLEALANSRMDPLYIEISRKEKYSIRWYINEEEVLDGMSERQLILGLDASELIGRDNLTGVFTDASTLECVGAFTVGESMIPQFAVWLAKLLAKYPNVTLVPENKNSWPAIRDTLLEVLPSLGVDPGKRIYSKIVDNRDVSESDRAMYQEYSKSGHRQNYQRYRRFFGFTTAGAGEHARSLLYGANFQEAASKSAHLARDDKLIQEISKLQKKNDVIDHNTNEHDDHVVSWLLTHWFLTYARNLSHYGIDVTRVKNNIRRADVKVDWKEELANERNQMIKQRINTLVEEMNETRDEAALVRLEARLVSLYNQLEESDLLEMESVDQVVRQAKEQRARQKTKARLSSSKPTPGTTESIQDRFRRIQFERQHPSMRHRQVDGGWA
ncbi:hypothetical protein ACLPJK_26070 [Pseudomonas aeruginosa]|uniref:hypothetical protein n=1 Tax=Pseudomonas aeruginosa TaxID=287 RepID=UPI003D2B2386